MFDSFLEGAKYYKYPSIEVTIYSLLLALILSTAVAFTYKITFRGKDFPYHLFQAMILSAIVTAMIMMAIGNNIAIGIGIIGVVAIIRFRTLFRNTRNIIFIFAALSTGIATGVYGYAIAVAGTVVFCLTAILLYYSPYGKSPGTISRINFLLTEEQDFELVFNTMKDFMFDQSLVEMRTRENGTRYDYHCEIKSRYQWKDVQSALKHKVQDLRIQKLNREEVV